VLHLKELGRRGVGKKVTGRDREILKDLEGLPCGRSWFAGTLLRQGCGGQAEEWCRLNESIIPD